MSHSHTVAQQMGLLTNYRTLVDRAVAAFGDEVKASKWLSMPNDELLQNQTPLEYAQRVGYDSVALYDIFEPMFVRIEHGIYF